MYVCMFTNVMVFGNIMADFITHLNVNLAIMFHSISRKSILVSKIKYVCVCV